VPKWQHLVEFKRTVKGVGGREGQRGGEQGDNKDTIFVMVINQNIHIRMICRYLRSYKL
jgi:hypothetical protein